VRVSRRHRFTHEFALPDASELDNLSTPPAAERRSVGPYRDARDSLIAKRRHLEADLVQAERAAERAARVRTYLPVLDAELREATDPWLQAIRVTTPCRARWEDMEGDDVTRHCTHCDRDVYEISRMSRDEIAALFTRAAESPCVRLQRRHDGRIVTADCPAPAARPGALRSLALAALVGGGLYTAAATTSTTLGGAARSPFVPSKLGVAATGPNSKIDPEPAPARAHEPDHDSALLGALGFPSPPEPVGPTDLNRHIRSTGPRTWEVDRSLVRRVLDEPPTHQRSPRIIPRTRDGEVIGVTLYGIRRGSVPFALGVRNGDLLLDVDGRALTSPDAALAVYARLRETDAAFVRLVRAGRERTHAYRILDGELE
jgi:hypothetical protein